MKIPHLKQDGKFRPQIRGQLESLRSADRVSIELHESGGYDDCIEVTIGDVADEEFEAAVQLSDPTRFPARIRAAATELRDQGFIGTYKITHSDGLLLIELLAKPTKRS